MTLIAVLVLTLALVAGIARGAWIIARFVRLPREAKAHLPAMLRARVIHRWLMRNLNLAYHDRHRPRQQLFGMRGQTGVKVKRHETAELETVRYPRARRWRLDSYGWSCQVRTIPRVGRREWEDAAEHVANAHRCTRVQVSQPRPGRLLVRSLVRDPLAKPLDSGCLPRFDGRRWLLGLDEWGDMRYASLAGIAGSVIGGNPGRGKSQGAASFAVQLAPVRNSRWYILDGGGGADWSCWMDRAARFATDDLAEARDVLEDAHALMVKRLATLAADLGTRNAWTIGPSDDYPMVWVPVDESSVYLDLEAAKAHGKDAEAQVRAIRTLVTGMLRRGRKVMFHTTLLAQKCTSTSIPPDIRDLAQLRMCFGVTTIESGIAVLGDDLRQFPTVSPTGLQGDEHVGVCAARLKTGADPYVRLRIPFVTEDQAEKVAAATAMAGAA